MALLKHKFCASQEDRIVNKTSNENKTSHNSKGLVLAKDSNWIDAQ